MLEDLTNQWVGSFSVVVNQPDEWPDDQPKVLGDYYDADLEEMNGPMAGEDD